MIGNYGLSFISDQDLFSHVQDTVKKYRNPADTLNLTTNMIDPIKLTFDSQIYQLNPSQLIQNEVVRQMDKSNTNHIGYFHQNIFKYVKNQWQVPNTGFDVIHQERHIFAEIKNKFNTMNAASSQKTYNKMQNKILEDDQATCYLVEVISKKSQDKPWVISLEGKQHRHNRIRRISIDHFYALVTGDRTAFYQLCRILPQVLADVLHSSALQSPSSAESLLPNINHISDLYSLTFFHYIGFNRDLFEGD